jgi:hypothetical protein
LQKLIGFAVFALFVCQAVWSQELIRGVVFDGTGTPLEHVGILVIRYPDSVLIAHNYSSETGSFALTLTDNERYNIVFQRLGFLSKSVLIHCNQNTDNGNNSIQVQMEELPIDLPEVIVNAEKPLRISKDTVALKVGNYLSGHERVAEDVLRQLPGVEVSPDGSIRVRGKIVSRVLIEGDDLFYNRYPMLTRNLDAGLIDEVQVLYHYSENPVLKDVQDSKAVAMNIRLKANVKGTWMGSSEIGSGMSENYLLRPNLIRVQKATKAYAIGNANNTGLEVSGDLPIASLGLLENGISYLGDQEYLDDFTNHESPELGLASKRLNFKAAQMASFSGVMNPIPHLKLRGQINYTHESEREKNAYFESFTADTLQFQNSVGTQTESGIHDVNYHITLQYLPKGHFLEWESQGTYSALERSEFLRFNKLPVQDFKENDFIKQDNRVSYTRKGKNRNAFQINFRTLDLSRNGMNQPDSIPMGLLGIGSTYSGPVQQTLDHELKFTGTAVNWYGRHGNKSLRLAAQWSRREITLTSNLDLSGTSDLILPGSEFQNNIGSQHTRSGVNLNFVVHEKPWSIQANLNFQSYTYDVFDGVPDLFKGKLWIPQFGVDWNPAGGSKAAFLRYTYQVNETSMSDWHSGYILTDFRSLVFGGGYFTPYREHNWFGGYTLGSWGDAFQLHTSLLYRQEPKYLGRQVWSNGDYLITKGQEFYNREFLTFNLQADHYFKALSGNLKGKGLLGKNQYQVVVNGHNYAIRTSLVEFGPEWKSILDGGVNFFLGYKWKFSQTHGEKSSNQSACEGFLDLDLQWHSKWLIKLANVRYVTTSGGSKTSTILSDLNLRMQPKSGRTVLNFEISNLWNTRVMEFNTLSETGITWFKTNLRPRTALFSIDFKF